jgi:hypothetical protein
MVADIEVIEIQIIVPEEPMGETDCSIFFLFEDNKQYV